MGRESFSLTLLVSLISDSSQSTDFSELLDKFTAVPAATRGGGVPVTGWARVAMAVQSLADQSEALMLVDLADGALIIIDWGRKDYWWLGGSGTFPQHPTVNKVRVFRGAGARLPFMQEQPSDLASLLWNIGLHAFPSGPAWWLDADAHYRLDRWPDFNSLEYRPEHVRMTALLGTGIYSAASLALSSGATRDSAQNMLNALGLMGLLRAEQPSEPEGGSAHAPAPGLFARLRARWGI